MLDPAGAMRRGDVVAVGNEGLMIKLFPLDRLFGLLFDAFDTQKSIAAFLGVSRLRKCNFIDTKLADFIASKGMGAARRDDIEHPNDRPPKVLNRVGGSLHSQ